MRLLIAVILIALLSFVAEYFFPWWTIALVAFAVVLLFRLNSGRAFLAGFLGIFLLWLCVALIRDSANSHILSVRMAELFHLPGSMIFMAVTALIGAIVGGLAGWSGAVFRKNLLPER